MQAPASSELVALVQDIGTASDLIGVFRALRTYAEALTGANALFVSLLEPGPNGSPQRRCVYAYVDGEEVDVSLLPPLPMTGGPHARAVATGEVVIAEDLQTAIANLANIPLGYDHDPRPPSVSIALPLAVLRRIVGGFEVQILEHPDPRSCVPGLQLAASIAAVTLDNIRLLAAERAARESAERAERKLRELNEGLEQRVQERTAELTETVQRLEVLSSELNQANRHKSEFLANMSHELRTPLNAIIGFSQVLLDHTSDQVTEEQRTTFVDHIHRSGQHLLRLINDILDLSKVEAGRMELYRERVAVADLIDGCTAAMRIVAGRKRINVSSRCDPPEAEVSVDPARFKQIIYNLLSNAVKFTPEGGNVTVESQLSGPDLRVSVRDDGIGIPSEQQSLIFEAFRQADPAGLPQREGTGLGLALVRKLVALHGGTVQVESTPGQGSRFTVVMPRE